MGRKTRILTRTNKFSLKFANHPLLKDRESLETKQSLLVEDFEKIIKEEIYSTVEDINEAEIDTVIEEVVEIKKSVFPKKVVKTKK